TEAQRRPKQKREEEGEKQFSLFLSLFHSLFGSSLCLCLCGSIPSYSTTQVSPLLKSLSRSPSPNALTDSSIWRLTPSSEVGRFTARKTPTGSGNSGRFSRDKRNAQAGSSAFSSWNIRSSILYFSPSCTSSGCIVSRFSRMPFFLSLPKTKGLPCS